MIKKFLTYSLVITTVVWSVGLLAMPLSVVAAESGDLIKLQCATGADVNDPCKAVYYLGANAKRYVFPNEKTYKSWYSDFSGVQIVSSTEMSSYIIGGNVTYRPGVKMVKITTDPKVYAVASDGTLRWITTAEVAEAIYGASWAAMVEDVSDAFFVNYTIGSDITAAADYDKNTETANSSSINDDKNLGGSASSGTGLTVALASDTPASSVAVNNAARVAFTKINLTASADGDITIDTWSIQRTGLGQDGAFSSIDIIDASTMLPINDSGKTFTSEHKANFTEDLTIPAGTTKSVILAGNMAASLTAYAGEAPALALAGLTLKGGAAVLGTLPISGNTQTLNATISIGTATVSRGGYTNATDTTLEVGKIGYTFFSFKVVNGSVEKVKFSQVKVYQMGSASLSTDLANIKLYDEGVELANGVVSGNYVTFTFPEIELDKGRTKQFQVKADVVSGSARVVELSIYRTTDLLVKGVTYGYNITPSYTGTGAGGTTSPVLQDNEFTISAGTLRVGRSNTVAAGNITIGNDQVLGAFEFEAKGEPVIISALTLTVVSSTASATIVEDALGAVKLVDENGVAVAGPTDVTNNALTVAFTDTFTVPTGLHTYKVVGNLSTSGGWTNSNTIYVKINTPASAITAKGDTTGLTITATPGSDTTASTQTIKTAALSINKNSTPTDKTVITNSTGTLIGSWTFDASNSGEDIRVTSIAVRASTTGKLNTLTLKDGTTALSPINDNPASSNDASTTSTFALSEPIIITKGTSKTINLYANVGSSALAGEVDSWGLTDTATTSNASVTAYGVTTNNEATITLTSHDGAAVTIAAAGTLTINTDSSSNPSRLVVANTTGEVLADVRLKATNEDVDITKLTVRVADGALTSTGAGDYTQLSKVYLKLDGSIVGNADGYTLAAATKEINFERGVLTVPAGSTGKKLSILGDIVEIGTNQPGTDNVDIKVGLSGANGFTAYGNGSNGSVTPTYTASTGSAVIIHSAVPQVLVKTPTGKLGATSKLHTVEITAVGGPIGIYKLVYQLSSSASVRATNLYITLDSCSGGCGGISSGSQLAATDAALTYMIDGIELSEHVVVATQSHGKSYLGIGEGSIAVISLSATVALTTNADTISTSI